VKPLQKKKLSEGKNLSHCIWSEDMLMRKDILKEVLFAHLSLFLIWQFLVRWSWH